MKRLLKHSAGRRGWIRNACWFSLIGLSVSCDHGVVSPEEIGERPRPNRIIGLVEVTIVGLGADDVTTHARSAASVVGLGHLRAARFGAGGAHLALSAPGNADASGDGTIQLSPVASGSFTDGVRGAGGVRYIFATYQVRNAQADGTTYDTPRQNLTFLAVDTDGTIDETAVSQLNRFDGSAAAPAIAPTMAPTGSVGRHATTGAVGPDAADVLQVLTEAEAATVLAAAPAGVHTVFPYGYVVHNPAMPSSRVLPDNPAVGQFDGLVTFAFKVPLQATPAEDPFAISVVFLAMDDTDTRVTESLEEQGSALADAGADALGPSAEVTLLGNSVTAVSGHGVRRVCRVRIAGIDPNLPVATLVDAGGCASGAVSIPGNVIVVDRNVTVSGDGRSWVNAIRHLVDALTCVRDSTGIGHPCEGVDEIWLAAGSHYPDEGVNRINNFVPHSFDVVDGVAIYGGFAGAEYARSQRDWVANITTLDADLDQDRTNGAAGRALTVLTAPSPSPGISRSTVLDGVTVSYGAQQGWSCVADGAGSACSPTLRNVVFVDNGDGSGASAGGATFVAQNGGTTAPLLERVTFTSNIGVRGGGLSVNTTGASGGFPELSRTTFDGNIALESGGALYLRGSGVNVDLVAHTIAFRNGSAGPSGSGGAVFAQNAFVRLVNAELWNNTADTAAAIRVDGGSSTLTLTGVTVAGNTFSEDGAIVGTSGITADLANTIVWGNTGPVDQVAGLSGTARSSLIAGACPTGVTCTGVLDVNPQFVSLGTGDLQLDAPSPAVDAGDNVLVPLDVFDLDGDGDTGELIPFDLAGQLRLFDWGGDDLTAIVDMGAYERQ